MRNGLFTYTLSNTLGFEVSITNYGGAITSATHVISAR